MNKNRMFIKTNGKLVCVLLIFYINLINFYFMKLTFKALAAVAVCALVSSCATISNPVVATSNPLGSKCGVAKSTLYLGGLWSSKGGENGIEKAAKSAGITKISHVDTYQKNYCLGIVTEQITKVYGE
jgi:hypothetical protein